MEKQIEICQNKLKRLKNQKKSPKLKGSSLNKGKILKIHMNDPIYKLSSNGINAFSEIYKKNQKNIASKRFSELIKKQRSEVAKKTKNSVKGLQKTFSLNTQNMFSSKGLNSLLSPTPNSNKNINSNGFVFSTKQSHNYLNSEKNNIKELKLMFPQNNIDDELSPITSRDNYSEYFSKKSDQKFINDLKNHNKN